LAETIFMYVPAPPSVAGSRSVDTSTLARCAGCQRGTRQCADARNVGPPRRLKEPVREPPESTRRGRRHSLPGNRLPVSRRRRPATSGS
jgi:hypothetical protein